MWNIYLVMDVTKSVSDLSEHTDIKQRSFLFLAACLLRFQVAIQGFNVYSIPDSLNLIQIRFQPVEKDKHIWLNYLSNKSHNTSHVTKSKINDTIYPENKIMISKLIINDKRASNLSIIYHRKGSTSTHTTNRTAKKTV